MAPSMSVDPVLVERYVMELARFGAYGETGVWRTVYTPEWVAATIRLAIASVVLFGITGALRMPLPRGHALRELVESYPHEQAHVR